MNDEITSTEKPEQELRGLSSWLILVQIGLWASLLVMAGYALAQNMQGAATGQFALLVITTGMLYARHWSFPISTF